MAKKKNIDEGQSMDDKIDIHLSHIAESIEDLKTHIKENHASTESRLEEGRKSFQVHHDRISSLEFNKKISVVMIGGLWLILTIAAGAFLNAYFTKKMNPKMEIKSKNSLAALK